MQTGKSDPLACKGLTSANLAANLPVRQFWMKLFEVNSLPTLFVGCWVVFGSSHSAAMALKAAQAKLQSVQFDQVIRAMPACCRFCGAAQTEAFDVILMQCLCAIDSCETAHALQNAKTRCGRSVAHLKAQINCIFWYKITCSSQGGQQSAHHLDQSHMLWLIATHLYM